MFKELALGTLVWSIGIIPTHTLKINPNYNCCSLKRVDSVISSTVISPKFEDVSSFKVGKATWYGNEFNGRLTANGEIFNQWGYSTASNIFPLGTWIKMCANGRCLDLRVTDRGGFKHEFDLSRGAFNYFALESQGILFINYMVL